MKIPLDQFEQLIDEKILQRGLDYFQKGRVHDLQEDKLGLTKKTAKTKNKTKSTAKKQKSPAEQLKELLNKASVDELKELISKEASRNMMFRNHVMTSLEHYNDNVSKEFYNNQLFELVERYFHDSDGLGDKDNT